MGATTRFEITVRIVGSEVELLLEILVEDHVEDDRFALFARVTERRLDGDDAMGRLTRAEPRVDELVRRHSLVRSRGVICYRDDVATRFRQVEANGFADDFVVGG